MIRDIIIRMTGMRQYVTTLQMSNEHISNKNQAQANTICQLEHSLVEQREINKKLYAHNQELQNEIKSLESELDKLEDKNREEENTIILHQKADIERLNDTCNKYNAQCAKFQHEVMKLRGTIGGLKKQLNKYEKRA